MIVVFAKAPVTGQAKTRLAPRLGEWGAARLQARLVRHALRTALAAGGGPVELHGTSRHALFRPIRHFRLQRGADLGRRMHHALVDALRRHRRVVLIGTDCPALTPRDLRRAEHLLKGACDAVLVPAEDGGYALIALRRISPRLFDGVAWGTADVYRQTVARMDALGYRWRALRTLWDIDRPEDLERLRSLRFPSAPRRGAPR